MMAFALAKAGFCSLVRYRRHGSLLQLRSAGFPRNLWADPVSILDGELFLASILWPGDTVVDVGENIGILSLLALRRVETWVL